MRTRDEARYTPALFRLFGWTLATASVEIQYFLGVFSPTPLIVTLGITFFGLGLDRRHALLIPLYAIAGYLALAASIMLGIVPDRGAFAADHVSLAARLFMTFMVPLVFLTTLWFARVSRRAMADAIDRSNEAMLLAGQREAQFDEVRRNLEEALRAGAGQRARYSGALAGRYRIAELVGRGAMGEVYAARRDETGETVAVKVLHREILHEDRVLARFLREGQLASSLSSPHIVALHDIGQLEDGLPYLAMELLEGEDLASLLRRRGQLEPHEIDELARHVAAGLDVAHAGGVVHRDLKPQNLFRHAPAGSAPAWKILDFGVSKLIGSEGTLTQRAVVGTPGYMAPEQAQGHDVDQRADLFALGALMYRVITGRPPFTGPDLPKILFEIVYRMPPRPSELQRALPPDIDRVLAIALAKSPKDRFATAAELASALSSAYAGRLRDELSRRGERLIRRYPWGERLDERALAT